MNGKDQTGTSVDMYGMNVYTYPYIESLREKDRKRRNPYKIISQRGGQERILSSNADISITGGSRGGSKSFSILLEALYDVYEPGFSGLILREDLNSLTEIVKTSRSVYGSFGTYNQSKDDMTWNFNGGGTLRFSYHGDSLDKFCRRFQGHQYCDICIDEITHIAYDKFKYIISTNRNASGLRNRVIGSCNPDPDSWVRKFIDWWIGDDGYPIPERDSVARYCFMSGDDVSDIIWGNTREEVYEQCRADIDMLYTEDMHRYGKPEDLFIKSVAFVEAKLTDNFQLMRSDPTYIASLAMQSEEQRARDLSGNWNYRSTGDDMIKLEDMENFYKNPYQFGDGIRRCSCDVAFDGGDMLTMWLWIGNHIQDFFVCSMDSRSTVQSVKAKLEEWGVSEENFTYDLNGIGQVFKGFFPRSVPFNNLSGVEEKYKYVYGNLKSQAAYLFAESLKNGEISINKNILECRLTGKHYKNMRLMDILNKERKSIRRSYNENSKGFCLIKKQDMKKIVGWSPDCLEGIYMKKIFDIRKHIRKHPKIMLRYVTSSHSGNRTL